MKVIVRRWAGLLGFLSRAPGEIGNRIDELKQSPAGRRVVAFDEKAGRLYGRARAALWFALCVPAAAIAYYAAVLTGGWLEITLVTLFGGVALFAACCAVSHLRARQAASEILVDELEDRVRPAKWLLGALRLLTGRRSTPAAE